MLAENIVDGHCTLKLLVGALAWANALAEIQELAG